MKETIYQTIDRVTAELRALKPRSQRRIILELKLRELRLDQFHIERRIERRAEKKKAA